LITPQFSCPGNAVLQFWSYVYLGSTNNDHYYIKVSTDNGNTWTVLWDATALTGGWNYYATPITIDLSSYTGQQIKLAWHADDPPSADGMWYVWFVDDILIGTPDNVLKFSTEELLAASKVNNSTPKMVYPSLPISRDRIKNPAISEPVLSVERPTENNRVLLGYRVYRLLAADQGNEANWTTLTPTSITPTTYVDNAWQPLPSGVYKFAVKAVYSNNVFSNAAFSNEIHKGMMGTLTGTVTEFGTNLPVQGATITAGEYTGQSDATGHFSFGVYAGTYTVTCTKPGYQPGSQAGVLIVGLQTTTQNFVLTELTLPPVNVHAEDTGAIANITWEAPGTATGITEGFESYADFSLEFSPWTLVDVDQSTTYGMSAITWPHAYEAQAYIIFNPTTTTPALTTLTAHTGNKMAACFASTTPPNNDWMISPQTTIGGGNVVKFWAKSYTADYGLERFKVGVSTTGTTPASFTIISGTNYVEAPVDWTEYTYDLSVYAGQQVYVGIQCISNDAFIFLVDDFFIGSPSKAPLYSKKQICVTSNLLATTIAKVFPPNQNSYDRIKYNQTVAAPKLAYSALPISRVIGNGTETQPVANIKSLPPAPVPSFDGYRVLTGYQVWRLLQGQETNESAWTSLTSTPISALSYADDDWPSLPDGTYKWAVKAVYTGGAYSVATFSNALPQYHEIGTIAGIVRNMQNQPISGATVTCGDVTATTNASGAYSMSVLAGTHSVTASHPNYASVTHSGIIVVTGQTTTVNFQLPPVSDLFSDSFENYANFALTFAPWTLVDVDLSATYGIENYTWENAYSPMAFIIFNPTATTPAMTTLAAHTGSKMACCFASTTPPNNDWMITPQLTGASSIKFWARSYVADYGLERFKVGVSNNTIPGSFTIISGANYIQAPVEWTEYTYQITQPGPLYIGIQCLSNDAFFFCVDDVTVAGNDINDPEIPVVATALNNNYPNPFNPETTISYSVKDREPVTIGIYNIKGQLVKTLLKGVQEPGNHTIVWNGTDDNGRSVSSGVYYYKMQAGKYSSTKKMIMMK